MNWQAVPGYFLDVDYRDYMHLTNMLPDGGSMVEIGSFRGKSLASVAENIKRKNLQVVSVDLFDKVISETYIEPDVYAKREGMYDDFMKTIEQFGLSEQVEVLVAKSTDAAELLSCRQFDMVFIDADHSYEGAKADIEAWWPLVKDGGIMAGHDYDHNNRGWPGVYKAVHERFGQPYFGCFIWAVRKTADGFNTNSFH